MVSDNQQVIEQYLDATWLERGLSENSLAAYRSDLFKLSRLLIKQNVSLVSASRADLMDQLAYMAGKKVSPRSQSRFVSAVKSFYRYCLREHLIDEDPSQELSSPKLGRSLPQVLSEQQVDALLAAPDADIPLELRDKAMLELMYAAGLRVSELVSLELTSVNLRQGVVRVSGKGNKERLVPVGEEALHWLANYMRSGRPVLLEKKTEPTDMLFPGRAGKPLTRQAFWHRLRHYAARIGLHVHISPHGLRHAFATHLVNNGANLRVVQLLLGHSDLSTTQIYTHVANQRLQALHRAHHPRA